MIPQKTRTGARGRIVDAIVFIVFIELLLQCVLGFQTLSPVSDNRQRPLVSVVTLPRSCCRISHHSAMSSRVAEERGDPAGCLVHSIFIGRGAPGQHESSVANFTPGQFQVCSPSATRTGRARESTDDQLPGRPLSARASRPSPQKKAPIEPAAANKPVYGRLPAATQSGFRCTDTL